MLTLNRAYNEQVKPELTHRQKEAMNRAVAAPPLRTLFTRVADKVHWYILDAPHLLRGKHFGVANSEQEAQETIAKILGPTGTARLVFS